MSIGNIMLATYPYRELNWEDSKMKDRFLRADFSIWRFPWIYCIDREKLKGKLAFQQEISAGDY